MTMFFAASIYERYALLIALFLVLLLMLLLLTVGGKTVKRMGNAALFLLGFTLLMVLGENHRALENGLLPHPLPLPLWLLWAVVVALALYACVSLSWIKRRRRQTLGSNSIKEALDTMPAGVCYFTSRGLVKLCNLQMQRLFHTMAQSDLQSLGELKGALAECDRGGGIMRIPGPEPAYLFPDGRVWLYGENQVVTEGGTAYTEAVFSDITQLYEKRREIEEQTRRLREISRKLHILSTNVAAMTKEEETLAFKTQLHDRLGAGLVAARQVLLQDKPAECGSQVFRLWQRSVELLQQDNEAGGERGELPDLLRDGAAIGVEIRFSGELPSDQETRQVFLHALRECLTNCARHAGGTELYARCGRDGSRHLLAVTNNGRPPEGKIIPGGGLTDLRRQTERCGGQLLIQSAPEFCLTLRIPEYRGELL